MTGFGDVVVGFSFIFAEDLDFWFALREDLVFFFPIFFVARGVSGSDLHLKTVDVGLCGSRLRILLVGDNGYLVWYLI